MGLLGASWREARLTTLPCRHPPEYNYPECTTSVLSALKVFTRLHPTYRAQEIARTISGAIKYIHASQRADGSWFGSWGICFTYSTNFALESLALAGETHANSDSVRRACAFLLSKQMEDGGWGETYMVSDAARERVIRERSLTLVGTSHASRASTARTR